MTGQSDVLCKITTKVIVLVGDPRHCSGVCLCKLYIYSEVIIMWSFLCLVVFVAGSLQLIKEYRELNEFKRDEQTFNEYKDKESDYLESKIENNDFDW